jgi:hypothetical protein
MSSASEGPEPEQNFLEKDGLILWSCLILGVFGLPFILFVIGKVSAFGIFAPAAHNCSALQDCSSSSAYYVGLTWLAIASCAALFGALGVMVSLMLRRKVDERIYGLRTSKILLLVYGSGAIFAILMLALFIGGFVQGNLFPTFSNDMTWLTLNFRVHDWGKLVVWSFVAGFSERIMPNLFDQLVEHFQSNDLRGNRPE